MHDLLPAPERVSNKARDYTGIQTFTGECNDSLSRLIATEKVIDRQTKSGFYDQPVTCHDLRIRAADRLAQFDIAGVEQALAAVIDQ